MAVLKKLADFIVFTNLFVAFAVGCLTFETSMLVDRGWDLKYPSFVFFATLFLYNFHRVYKLGRESTFELQERHRWVLENKVLFYSVFVLAAAGLAYTTLAFLDVRTILLLLPVSLISFAYSMPIFRWKKKRSRLRDIPGIKIILIAFVLAWVTVLIPFSYYGLELLPYRSFYYLSISQVAIAMLIRMFFIFAITIPFDMRDVDYDRAQGVRTIPVVLGEKRSKLLALAALVMYIILVYVQVEFFGGYWKTGLALIGSALVAAAVIAFTRKGRSEYYYSFLVEGTMVVQAGLVFIPYL